MKNNEKLFVNDAIAKCNKFMLSAAIILFGIGVIAVFEADYSKISFASKGVKQFIWAGGAILIAAFFTLLNYKKLESEKKLKTVLLFFTALLVILAGCSVADALFDFGKKGLQIGFPAFGIRKINGAYRWLNLGSQGFQPSVFLKVVLILFAALKLSQVPDENKKKMLKNKSGEKLKDIALDRFEKYRELIFFSALIIILVLMQPSNSVAISLFVPLFAMFVLKDTKFLVKMFVPAAIFFLAVFIIIWNFAPNFQNRIKRGGDNFQSEQAVLAISSGGFWGLGIGKGAAKYPGRLPEVENDFIFSLIAQETGFFGSIIFLGIYALFIFMGFSTALNTQDSFGKLAAFGITVNYSFAFLAHLFVNLGFINTGASLPFVSYGGTATFADAAMLGILLNISSSNRKYERIRE